jgi:nicotinate dehydrogenase subunit B
MKNPILPAPSRAALLARPGILAIVRSGAAPVPELFIAVLDDGSVTGFNSHVDLGTGIRTALAQIVAEELDAPLASVRIMLGDTEWAPDLGMTIASETIQFAAAPLRHAAAQARHALLSLAAERFGVAPDLLAIAGGEVAARTDGNLRVGFGELVAGLTLHVELDLATPVKSPDAYQIVGRSVPRVDVAGKATGELVFVHDVRLPGMLHGRVVRPPYLGRDAGPFIGHSLLAVEEASIAHIPGIVKLVVIHDFIGIVAQREDQAEAAARDLRVQWAEPPPLPDLESPEQPIRDNPRTTRKLVDRGDVEAALEEAAVRLTRSYVWPYHMHGSIGPSCSVAAFDAAGRLTIWSGTQTQPFLIADVARLLAMDPQDIDIVRMEASGSYGRNAMDDVGADAALLARAVGRPVRVQLTRAQEHMSEPKGAAQLMEVDGGIDASGKLLAYDYQSSYPSNISPALALLLTRTIPAEPALQTAGDRTAIPLYDYPHLRIRIHDMAPIVRASFMRGVSALPTCFAHEAYIDELAEAAGADPIAYRLRSMTDQRAIDLAQAVAARAGWAPHVGPRQQVVSGDVVRGRGFAQAVYVHGPWPGKAAAWSAWVADVEVDRRTGEVSVTRIVAGQDSGMMINPDGVRHQIQGNVIQSTSRTLKERVTFDRTAVTSRDWGTYPILAFPDVPRIDVVMIPRPNDPPLGVGESASVPSAAAIVNAVYDATGVRFRELPLTPERVLAGLGRVAPPAALPAPGATGGKRSRTIPWGSIAAGAAALLSAGTILWPVKPSIAPIPRPGPGIYSAETLERGRVLAAAGDCAVCHTAPSGIRNAGGRALKTPFGTVWSTNLTPDPETGIGAWSYPAFERAMRYGISRDGRLLYPAFPYTAFTRMSDADLEALYAWLMAQPAVQSEPPPTSLRFPFRVRAMLAAWNGLFLKPGPLAADPSQSAAWNRGAYLVESVGHCSACHTPRNALGAERQGDARYGGAMADGWEAPALGTHSHAPVPWSEAELFTYLRGGASDLHGPAGGPMAPVIDGLRALGDADIRAIATYLASLAPPADPAAETRAAEAIARAGDAALYRGTEAARLFDGACAVCHAGTAPEMFGARLPLTLNSNVHSPRPDNLIRVILDGMADPANPARGAMPGFRHVLDDRQLAELIRYIRRTQAPSKPAWDELENEIARIRND